MKPAILLLVMVLGGSTVGGASALTITLLRPQAEPESAQKHVAAEDGEPPEFVPAEVLVPLVFSDGQLAGYASVKLELRVATGGAEEVKTRLPLLLNAINLQTYRTPLASGSDGRMPDLAGFRKLVQRSADQSLGKGTILQVAITEARTS